MKTTLVALSTALSLCAALCAQTAPKSDAPVDAKQRVIQTHRVTDPAARSNLLAKTGGMIQAAATGPVILFLNAQKRVTAPALRETPDQIQKLLYLPCTFRDKPSETPIADAINALAETNCAGVIVIGDSAGYPSLLVAPENRWVLINVAALGGQDVSIEQLTERVQKETWRAFGYVMGAANSNFEHCLLKPVFQPADLDALKIKVLSPEPFNKIMLQAQKLGMSSVRITSYRKAVQEGWAPAPTNDCQRAIWQELKK